MTQSSTSSRQETLVNHPATPAATRRFLAMLDALRATFGERVSIADAVAPITAATNPVRSQLPDAVVFAHNADEVRAVVSLPRSTASR
jgi:D-lactate dehydrogenase (cytochrome)